LPGYKLGFWFFSLKSTDLQKPGAMVHPGVRTDIKICSWFRTQLYVSSSDKKFMLLFLNCCLQ